MNVKIRTNSEITIYILNISKYLNCNWLDLTVRIYINVLLMCIYVLKIKTTREF
jgi:hypothetical protein